jgi:transposase
VVLKNRESLKINERKWQCENCRKKHDRDINAAINLLKLASGHEESLNACGEAIRPIYVSNIDGLFSMKQETSQGNQSENPLL